MPNVWSVVKMFKITCRWLEVFLTVRVSFFFYGTKINIKHGWVTLCILSWRKMLKPHSEPYKDWKDTFLRVRGWDCASMITTKTNVTPRFPLLWARDPKNIIDSDFDYLTSFVQEVNQVLNDSKVTSSHALITLDWGEDNKINEYLSEFMVKQTLIFKLFICYNAYVFLVSFPQKKCLKFLWLVRKKVENQLIDKF